MESYKIYLYSVDQATKELVLVESYGVGSELITYIIEEEWIKINPENHAVKWEKQIVERVFSYEK